MTIDEAARIIDTVANASIRPDTMCQTVGEIAKLALLDLAGVENATEDEIIGLVQMMANTATDHYYGHAERVEIGGKPAYFGRGTIQQGAKTLRYSPRVPGLHVDLPEDFGAAERIKQILGEELSALGHCGPGAEEAWIGRSDRHKNSMMLDICLPAPEDPRFFQQHSGHFAHESDDETRTRVHEVARHIAKRWLTREEIASRIKTLHEMAEAFVSRERGLTVLHTTVHTVDWSGNGRVQALTAKITLKSIGDNLRPIERVAIFFPGPGGQENLQYHVRKHRAAQRAMDATGEVHICSILANAIRLAPSRYHAGLLREIEAVLDGKSVNPSNPRKRKISNISLHAGLISAPVTLSESVRHEQGRLVIKKNKFPDTILHGVIGRPINQVIGHPFLTDAPVLRASNSNQGVYLRPERRSEPVEPILEMLRGANANQDRI